MSSTSYASDSDITPTNHPSFVTPVPLTHQYTITNLEDPSQENYHNVVTDIQNTSLIISALLSELLLFHRQCLYHIKRSIQHYGVLLLPDTFKSDVEEVIHIISKHWAGIACPPSPHHIEQMHTSLTTSYSTPHPHVDAITGLLSSIKEASTFIVKDLHLHTHPDWVCNATLAAQLTLLKIHPLMTIPSDKELTSTTHILEETNFICTEEHLAALYTAFTETHEEIVAARTVTNIFDIHEDLPTATLTDPAASGQIPIEAFGHTSPSSPNKLITTTKTHASLLSPPPFQRSLPDD
ncbi:hypothetical protein BDR04DRAFT_1159589 [Suillus decipiens]|nr:hypothetical protein BDR04DRAFT_1159589 [Suillus decipiens]